MFPYNILIERQTFLKQQIDRLTYRLKEDECEIIKNELTEAEELLKLVEENIYEFKKQNTNK